MQIKLLLIAAMCLPNVAVLSQEPETAMIEAVEGEIASIDEYIIKGRLQSRDANITLGFDADHHVWTFEVRQGGSRWLTTFSIALLESAGPHLDKITISTRSHVFSDNVILVRIPYGDAMSACFINGDEVYRSVLLYIDDGMVIRAEELAFDNCTPYYSSLDSNFESSGVFVIGGR